MKFLRVGFVVVGVCLGAALGGCATPLNSMQKSELRGYEVKGLAVTEKDPGVGAALGILPGGGSFYVREYGMGVVNLLLWPASVLWDPVSGYQGAENLNYYATKAAVNKAMGKEMQGLEDDKALGAVNTEQYILRRRDIEKKYSPDV